MNTTIHIPTKEEDAAHLELFFEARNRIKIERRAACQSALPALERLATVMCERSGQPYKVREILFSLWNGKPAALIEIVNLDWEIRKDLCAVIMAFGYEDSTGGLFYDAVQSAVTAAGQWDWFIEERENLDKCREYVKCQNQRRKEAKNL